MGLICLTNRLVHAMIEQKLPGLFYADYIVLSAYCQDGIQRLVGICGKKGDARGLGFSATMVPQ